MKRRAGDALRMVDGRRLPESMLCANQRIPPMLRSRPLPSFALLVTLTLGSCTTPSEDEGPKYATEFTAVTLERSAPVALKLAVQACAGLNNRKLGGSVYVQSDDNDARWLKELGISAARTVSANDFLASCVVEFPTCVRYDHATQQTLLPSILTAGAALGAVPLDTSLDVACADVVFDATVEFADKATPELATRHVFEKFAEKTTGLAMLNPGYETFLSDPPSAKDWSNPPLIHEMSGVLVDYVYSRRLFVVFLLNGCSSGKKENKLLSEIVNAGHWETPVPVYGYNNSWLVAGGFIHEAQTNCLSSRNMGAVPTETFNMSFFSTRRAPIDKPGVVVQTKAEDITYDSNKTYVAFVIGDGDNIDFIMTTRNVWLAQRLAHCKENPTKCAPISWSISPNLTYLAPDVLEWYYAQFHETGADYVLLPPSGHLYAYPSAMNGDDQDRFVEATERDARLLDTHSVVHWDFAGTWHTAEFEFLPKYALADDIRGIVPLNVPYMVPAFPEWSADSFSKVLDGKVALFRPRQWRGVDGRTLENSDELDVHFLKPTQMSEEISGYPKGTVTTIYTTSDGGLSLQNSVLTLIDLLPEHVQFVSADTAARLAVEASSR